jgi:hypothetical protein
MEEQLSRLESKLDSLLREVADLKKRLDRNAHMARDEPMAIRQAGQYLRLSVSSIYKLIYAGELNPIQRHKKGRILFSIEELNRFLKNDKKITTKDQQHGNS